MWCELDDDFPADWDSEGDETVDDQKMREFAVVYKDFLTELINFARAFRKHVPWGVLVDGQSIESGTLDSKRMQLICRQGLETLLNRLYRMEDFLEDIDTDHLLDRMEDSLEDIHNDERPPPRRLAARRSPLEQAMQLHAFREVLLMPVSRFTRACPQTRRGPDVETLITEFCEATDFLLSSIAKMRAPDPNPPDNFKIWYQHLLSKRVEDENADELGEITEIGHFDAFRNALRAIVKRLATRSGISDHVDQLQHASVNRGPVGLRSGRQTIGARKTRIVPEHWYKQLRKAQLEERQNASSSSAAASALMDE